MRSSRFERPKSPDDACTLQSIVEKLKEAATAYGRAPAAKRWQAFAEAVEITRLVIEGHQAIMSAVVDADRFLRAARSRLKNLRQDVLADPYIAQLIEVLDAVDGEIDPPLIRKLREQIASVPMPIAVYADPEPQRPDWAVQRKRPPGPQAPDLAVAFVEFKIDGTVAERLAVPSSTRDARP